MAQPEDSMRRVDVRLKWPHEAHDFTPWLAEHLDLLGAELGLKLEAVDQEVPVGPYSLDILATTPVDGDEVRVAIENQLEWSDVQHLGQLLTYATGLDANVAVWVAPEFRHQLAEALHRLNEWTHEQIRFYGVRVELLRNEGSSELTPRFHKVVWPGDWDEAATTREGVQSEEARLYEDFFRPLIHELVRSGFAATAKQHFDHTGRFFTPALAENVGYAASLERGNNAWVIFHVRTDDVDRTNRIFEELHRHREAIEADFANQLANRTDGTAALAPEWNWGKYELYAFSSISIRRDGTIYADEDERERTREWMLTLLPVLKEVFDPRIEAILDRLPADDGR